MVLKNLRRLIPVRPTTQSFAPPAEGKPQGEFASAFFSHTGLPVQKWWQYFSVYDHVIASLRSRFDEIATLEIGVSGGGSLQLMHNLLGEKDSVWGIDISEACRDLPVAPARIRIGSQTNRAFLESVVEEMGSLHLVIDDGSHIASHQLSAFKSLFPLLKAGGFYVIEDASTSYWWRHGGGWRRPFTAISFAKSLVDVIHHPYHRVPLTKFQKSLADSIRSVTFADSIIVIEKCANNARVADQRP